MLVRFEAENPTTEKRCGIYNALPNWFFEDYLKQMELLPYPVGIPIGAYEKLSFFFTKEGFDNFAYILGDIFWEPILLETINKNHISLFVAFIEDKFIPVYKDKYQKAIYRDAIPELEYKPITSLNDWLRLEKMITTIN